MHLRGEGSVTQLTYYATFAFVAIAGNISSQDITLRIYRGPYDVPASILVGTIVGLIIKYSLDKRFVFHCSTNHVQEDAFLFVTYSAMGLFTTAIFWGIELGFDALFDSHSMRYLGGIVGLSCGYALKYRLDSQFVFSEQGAAGRSRARTGMEVTS
jgi:hypothetical protein